MGALALNTIEQLVRTTARIETTCPNGIGSGTGFFLNLGFGTEKPFTVLVTNKHVINGAQKIDLFMSRIKPREAWEPAPESNVKLSLNTFMDSWILHPSPSVDLAALPFIPVMNHAYREGTPVYFRSLPSTLIPSSSELEELNAIEDIVMIGYPNGIWDDINNFPIVRRGITATPVSVPFRGRSEFVVDCACFPGSSGSPILLFNAGPYMNKVGDMVTSGGRVRLLGVLWGGPQYDALGELHVVPIPTSNASAREIALSRIPMNLGYCVRAEELKWFEQYFRSNDA